MHRLIAALFITSLLAAPAAAQNEIPVTYQGMLNVGGAAADGLYDFRFTIYDAETAGSVVAGPLGFTGVEVDDGFFTVELDYPRDGTANQPRWLEIEARESGVGAFETLSPRQRITPVPEAGNTQAARLQPDGRVLIGTGTALGAGAAFDTLAASPNFLIRDDQIIQTFIAEATGTPVQLGALFNETPVGPVDVLAEVYAPGSPPTLIASGSVAAQSGPFNAIPFDTVNGFILCDEPYELVITYTRSSDGQPVTATTGGLNNDVYPFGEVVGRVGIDVVASIGVDRGTTNVTVFDDGLALLNGGIIVGPDDSGDTGAVLPKDSVNPGEMLGEPGIAKSVPADASDPFGTLRAVRVLAPVDGYVLAIGSASFDFDDSALGDLTLQSSTGLQFSNAASVFLAPGSNSDIPITVHGLFPIEANQQIDIYLRFNSTDLPSNVLLNAMFFPTDYSAPGPLAP
jgi:hypothetical protein